MRFRLMPCAAVAAASVFLLATYSPLAALADSPPPYEPPAAAASNVPGKVILPERTQVKLILDDDLKSGSAKVGDEVDYELENDLYTPDRQFVAPAGTKAYGHVLKSSRHGMFGKPGNLQISADYLLAPDRTHIPLRGNEIGNGGKNEAVGMVAMTLFVSVLGVFINGRDVNLHKGLEIPMYVNEDTPVTPYMTLINNSPNASLGIISTATGAPKLAAPAAPGRRLYTLNDGTMVVGTQGAFDGTTYAVVTDSGMKLVKASDIKHIDDLAPGSTPAPVSAPTPGVAPTPTPVPTSPVDQTPADRAIALVANAPVAATPASSPPAPTASSSASHAPPPALAPAWVEYTMNDGTKYVGQPDGQATDGSFVFIKNTLGRRILHASDIAKQKSVSDRTAGLKDGAVE